jgi:hypothetical protein
LSAIAVREAFIRNARIAAAHEGIAELVVTLEHANGGLSEISLDQIATAALLDICQVSHAEQLQGHGWHKVRDALTVSMNRFL